VTDLPVATRLAPSTYPSGSRDKNLPRLGSYIADTSDVRSETAKKLINKVRVQKSIIIGILSKSV
ncbi:MAG: hypothetical protein ACK53L_12930, partial [Pirellulaceae bacterium]